MCSEAGRPSPPYTGNAGGAVLVPPTGNRVLNQIPAGDSRESSREQAVPDDGVLLLYELPLVGAGDHSPILEPSDLAAEPPP